MKYIRGTQTYSLEDPKCKLTKVSLSDGKGFSESPWAVQFPGENHCVLQNHALAFTPHESWGAIIPGSFNFLPMLEKQELTLHPEAWAKYIEHGIIDEQGNYIKKESAE
jgi:hypothetical protein